MMEKWTGQLQTYMSTTHVGIAYVVYGMITIAVLTFLFTPNNLPWWRVIGTLLGLLLLALTYLYPHNTQWPYERKISLDRIYSLLVVGFLVLLINSLGLHGGYSFLPYLLFMLMGHAITILPFPVAVFYGFTMQGLFVMMLIWLNGTPLSHLWDDVLGIAVGMLFTAMFSLMAVRYGEESARANKLLEELQVAHEELKAAREREKALAVAEERVRLARDIHDGLGHHLTVLNVQLQAAEKLIERNPSRSAKAIAICKEVAQAALREVRQSVASLHRSPLDGHSLEEALTELVNNFDRHSPIHTHFQQQGQARQLAPAAAMTLYRATQEALTNVQKHAQAEQATVSLHFLPDQVTLTVCNDGPTIHPNGKQKASRFGLAGLQARVKQLDGTFEANPLPEGGFRLALSLPM